MFADVFAARTPPRMADLQKAFGAVLVNCIRQFLHAGNVFIIVDYQHIGGISAQRGIYAGNLHHDQPHAPFGARFIVIDHGIVDKARVALIHAHRRHDNAVF
ncbi:hypothetical protein SDC9_150973 [bioreactor metagenome]|uniref:Uncharacterized protein n=1 Tax=bioreactor metagenome TaxID=1076179 RepID=A0A645EP14_9ZZZZ